MEAVKEFLKKNGFTFNNDMYYNEKCSVSIESCYYGVLIYDKGYMYSQDLNIYWLIGVLTYYNLIDKNYS